MSANQSANNNSLLTLGSRYPRQVGGLRVAIGVWLLVLTAILAGSGGGSALRTSGKDRTMNGTLHPHDMTSDSEGNGSPRRGQAA